MRRASFGSIDIAAGVFALVAAALSVLILMAIAGVIGPLNPDLPALPAKDLLGRSLLHTFYGLLSFAMIALSGLGLASILRRPLAFDDADILIYSIPMGIVVCLAFGLMTLVGTVATVASTAVLAALILFRAPAVFGLLRRSGFPFARSWFVVVMAFGLGAHFGIHSQPPGPGSGGTADGDLITYIANFFVLGHQLYPFLNLGAEGELAGLYFNQLPNFIAFGLRGLPGFEIGFFLTVGVAAYFVCSLCFLLFGLGVAGRAAQELPVEAVSTFLVVLLLVAAPYYPSWLVESPPIAYMTGMSLALVHAVQRAGGRPGRLFGALGLAFTGSILTKVVSFVVMVSFVGMAVLTRALRQLSRLQLILLFAVGLVLCGYVAFMLIYYADDFFPRFEFGPESRLRLQQKGWSDLDKVIPWILRDLGLVLILLGTAFMRNVPLFFATLVAVVFEFALPFLFHAAPMTALVMIAGTVLQQNRLPRLTLWLIGVGCMMILYHHLVKDPGKWHMAVVWILTMGPAVWIAGRSLVVGQTSTVADDRPSLHLAGAALVLLTAVSVVAAARGDLRLGDDKHQMVPAALYEIWEKTRDRTPPGALVFTDQTGDDPGRLTGWNDLSMVAMRQFYISSWQNSRLRHDDDARHRRLEQNAAVLAGALAPRDLSLSRQYDGFYAVIEIGRAVPSSYKLLYANDGYALYRIDDH